MKYLFSPEGLGALESRLGRPTLLAFAFDGVLAPTVANASAAAMRFSTRVLVADLASRMPAVVVTRRAHGDVAKRLVGVALADVLAFGASPLDEAATDAVIARALKNTAQRQGAATWIFVGAQAEDEALFAAAEDRALTVRVGAHRHSRATWFIREQLEVDRLLQWLLHFQGETRVNGSGASDGNAG